LSRTKFGEQQLDPNEIEKIFVTNRTHEVGVEAVVIHEGYLSDAPEGSIDIAILTLNQPLRGSKPVQLVGQVDLDERVIYLARNSGPRSVVLESCPLGLGRPYYSYGRTNFQCINHIERDQIGTCAGDSGSPIISIDPEGIIKLVAIQHAGHSLEEKLDAACRNGHESLAYGVTLTVGPLVGWVNRGVR
ncbi:MAG: trypsin-like serine protease, partial [Chloroflexota bacterium]